MRIQITCSNCGVWFYTNNEDEECCQSCKKSGRKPVLFSYPKDGGTELAQRMFEVVVENKDKGGVSTNTINKELARKHGLNRKGFNEVVSVLDRSGYLVYMEGNRIFPYKNMHTGKVYEDE